MLYTRLEDIPTQFFNRIVSVVPSQTKLLADLNLEKEVLGITKFCVHPPEWKKEKSIVGGTKNLNINKIIDLKPNLILANKEENVQDQIEALSAETSVFLTDVNDYEGAMQMIVQIGKLTNRIDLSVSMVSKIQIEFSGIEHLKEQVIKAVYLIWNDPMMTVGGDTFINSMMEKAGFENVFAHFRRYPAITDEMIAASQAECLLLSSEPYPFSDKHLSDFSSRFPQLKIKLVDGEAFSWYGSTMLDAPRYFEELRINRSFC